MLIFEWRTICRTSDMFFINLGRHKGRPLSSLWFINVNKPLIAILEGLWRKMCGADWCWAKKLLEVNNITLDAAMDKVWKWEASREQASQMVTPNQEVGTGTNVVEEKSGHRSKGKSVCFNCGKEGHYVQSKSCTARGRKCSNCGKYGHYPSCCKGGRNPKSGKQDTTQQQGVRKQRRGKGRQTTVVKDFAICKFSNVRESFIPLYKRIFYSKRINGSNMTSIILDVLEKKYSNIISKKVTVFEKMAVYHQHTEM